MVEDDKDLRFMLKLLLERAGYLVSEAADGLMALRSIEESMPSAVVTDIRMPRMDGAALMEHIRYGRATAKLPIILISAYSVPPETARLADHVVSKPFAPERIVDLVASLIGGRGSTGSTPSKD